MALLAIDIMNEPRWGVCDAVATRLLKINPNFFSIKTQKTQIKKPPNISKINA